MRSSIQTQIRSMKLCGDILYGEIIWKLWITEGKPHHECYEIFNFQGFFSLVILIKKILIKKQCMRYPSLIFYYSYLLKKFTFIKSFFFLINIVCLLCAFYYFGFLSLWLPRQPATPVLFNLYSMSYSDDKLNES